MTQTTEPELTGVRNFRDVGGLPTADGGRTRHGRLYRSGHLAHATAEDTAFLGSLGLHTVFDFRNDADIRLDGPDVDLPGVRNVNLPLNDPAEGKAFWKLVRDGDIPTLRSLLGDGKAVALMEDSYRDMILRRNAEHSRVLHTLADGATPALLHCAAGKDRAGLTVALALLAVGVEREAIEADYLESNAQHRRYRVRRGEQAQGGTSPEVMELLSPLFDARASYLGAAFDTIAGRWGSVEGYLREALALSDATRQRLRERLVAA
jgi:protein-tyrosine phosphatase